MANSTNIKGEQLSSLTEEQLNDQIAESSLSLKKLKFSHSINPIENPMKIRSNRRLIARLKTEQGKRASK